MKDIIAELSIRLDWRKQDVEKMITTLGDVIGDKLANNDIAYLDNFGQFESKKKDERVSINPTNGKRYLIPPKLVAAFKPVAPLKTYLKILDNNG
ncbi:MAG: HU family DNA-binding protein [Tannerella sp.]|jgi:DNA-binding protein HU-beta|nr:HU family DNA-binding protein [Tannerella sp.]